MSRIIKIVLALVFLVLLVLLRAYENELFYDPLIQFFETSHTTEVLPALDFVKLVLHTTFRFLLNTLLSLAILWILFQKREIVKVAAILYGVVFILLLIVFVFLVNS